MATDSQDKLSGGEAGDNSGEEGDNDELRLLPNPELQEKSQRMQEVLDGGIDGRLPDGGKKFCRMLCAVRRELARRQAPPLSSSRPPRPHDRHGEPDDDKCKRIVQSRCAESSVLASDSYTNHGVAKSDFIFVFRMDEEAGIDVSRLEITRTSPGEPKTLVENEGKLCEEEESCKPARQPTDLSHKESYIDNSTKVEYMSADDDCKDNGHSRICEHAPTPCQKRKGAASVNFSMRLRSRKMVHYVLSRPDRMDGWARKLWEMRRYLGSREHCSPVFHAVSRTRGEQLYEWKAWVVLTPLPVRPDQERKFIVRRMDKDDAVQDAAQKAALYLRDYYSLELSYTPFDLVPQQRHEGLAVPQFGEDDDPRLAGIAVLWAQQVVRYDSTVEESRRLQRQLWRAREQVQQLRASLRRFEEIEAGEASDRGEAPSVQSSCSTVQSRRKRRLMTTVEYRARFRPAAPLALPAPGDREE